VRPNFSVATVLGMPEIVERNKKKGEVTGRQVT
jgi:hypothetical protein